MVYLKGPFFYRRTINLQGISLFGRLLSGVIRARLTFFALPPVKYRCNNTLKAILALLTYLVVFVGIFFNFLQTVVPALSVRRLPACNYYKGKIIQNFITNKIK